MNSHRISPSFIGMTLAFSAMTLSCIPVMSAEDPDTDYDGIVDSKDNCDTIPNVAQLDSDKDGIGNVCDANLAGVKDSHVSGMTYNNPKMDTCATLKESDWKYVSYKGINTFSSSHWFSLAAGSAQGDTCVELVPMKDDAPQDRRIFRLAPGEGGFGVPFWKAGETADLVRIRSTKPVWALHSNGAQVQSNEVYPTADASRSYGTEFVLATSSAGDYLDVQELAGNSTVTFKNLSVPGKCELTVTGLAASAIKTLTVQGSTATCSAGSLQGGVVYRVTSDLPVGLVNLFSLPQNAMVIPPLPIGDAMQERYSDVGQMFLFRAYGSDSSYPLQVQNYGTGQAHLELCDLGNTPLSPTEPDCDWINVVEEGKSLELVPPMSGTHLYSLRVAQGGGVAVTVLGNKSNAAGYTQLGDHAQRFMLAEHSDSYLTPYFIGRDEGFSLKAKGACDLQLSALPAGVPVSLSELAADGACLDGDVMLRTSTPGWVNTMNDVSSSYNFGGFRFLPTTGGTLP